MEEKYNWNLQDIFENEEQFKKEKGEIADILEKIKTYQEKIVELETFEIQTVLKEADLSINDIKSIIDDIKLSKEIKEEEIKEKENSYNNS